MADGGLPGSQAIENGAAGGIGERPEDLIQIMFNHSVEYIGLLANVQPFG